MLTPLTDKNHFRLVRVVSAAHEGSIHCEVQTFSLHTAPEFHALSYRWTAEAAVYTVIVNGKACLVRPNLYDFLCMIRNESITTWHYIDALCVDQKNCNERAAQVSLMGKIYPMAARVVIWLGAYTRQKARILERNPWLQDRPAWIDDFIERSDDECPLDAMRGYTRPKKGVLAVLVKLLVVFQDAYWTRLWVVQEVVLARSLELRFACWRMSGQLLERLSRLWGIGDPSRTVMYMPPPALRSSRREVTIDAASGRSFGAMLGAVSSASNILSTRALQQKGKRNVLSFFDMMLQFSPHQCSVQHDHVFALSGLTDMRINIDYEMPTSRLYVLALTEGLLSAQEVSVGCEQRQAVARDSNVSNFIVNLSSALGLNIEDTTPYLLTREVLMLIDPLTAAETIQRAIVCRRLSDEQERESRLRTISSILKDVSKDKSMQSYSDKLGQKQERKVRITRLRKQRMAISTRETDMKTVAEWKDFARVEFYQHIARLQGHVDPVTLSYISAAEGERNGPASKGLLVNKVRSSSTSLRFAARAFYMKGIALCLGSLEGFQLRVQNAV